MYPRLAKLYANLVQLARGWDYRQALRVLRQHVSLEAPQNEHHRRRGATVLPEVFRGGAPRPWSMTAQPRFGSMDITPGGSR